jgi:hypothetical protein
MSDRVQRAYDRYMRMKIGGGNPFLTNQAWNDYIASKQDEGRDLIADAEIRSTAFLEDRLREKREFAFSI